MYKNSVQRPWWTIWKLRNHRVLHHHSITFWPNPYKQQGEMCEGGVLVLVIHGYSGMYSRFGWRQCNQFTLMCGVWGIRRFLGISTYGLLTSVSHPTQVHMTSWPALRHVFLEDKFQTQLRTFVGNKLQKSQSVFWKHILVVKCLIVPMSASPCSFYDVTPPTVAPVGATSEDPNMATKRHLYTRWAACSWGCTNLRE